VDHESGDDVALVRELVAAVPEYEGLYETHEYNNHGVAPHVFLWDMTQEALESYRDDPGPDALWRRTIAFLENRLGRSKEADTVIGTSFLYSLPWPAGPGYEIVEELGPKLRRMFSEVRAGDR
jgi:hypothetical protein